MSSGWALRVRYAFGVCFMVAFSSLNSQAPASPLGVSCDAVVDLAGNTDKDVDSLGINEDREVGYCYFFARYNERQSSSQTTHWYDRSIYELPSSEPGRLILENGFGELPATAVVDLAANVRSPVPAPSEPIVRRDASNTGVPAGVTLKKSGAIVASTAGQVIEGLDIDGSITIQAPNVTIRNCRIRSDATYVIGPLGDFSSLVIEDTEIDGMGRARFLIVGGGFTFRRVNGHSAVSDMQINGSDVLIEDSFLHDLVRTPTSHNDVIQIRKGKNIVIRRNSLIALTGRDFMNAALQIGSLNGTEQITDLLFEENYCNGGNYTINGGGRGEIAPGGATARNNRFGTDFRYRVKGNLDRGAWTWKGNVDDATGRRV
jgi:hypothetical protein